MTRDLAIRLFEFCASHRCNARTQPQEPNKRYAVVRQSACSIECEKRETNARSSSKCGEIVIRKSLPLGFAAQNSGQKRALYVRRNRSSLSYGKRTETIRNFRNSLMMLSLTQFIWLQTDDDIRCRT